MQISTGIDVVKISKFKNSLTKGGETFTNKIFTKLELGQNKETQSLAGIFAAKEAVIKALKTKNTKMTEIEIQKPNGIPQVEFKSPQVLNSVHASEKPITCTTQKSVEISITHDDDYAIAVCIIISDEYPI